MSVGDIIIVASVFTALGVITIIWQIAAAGYWIIRRIWRAVT